MLDYLDVVKVYKRIEAYTVKAPVLENAKINSHLGMKLFFKCEGFQKVGAFKARGALNFLLTHKPNKPLLFYQDLI